MAPTLTQGAGRLPRPAFSLIGRHAELAPLVATFADPDARLLTLTGPPGVGKTRLALAVAAEAAPRFADGVVFVDLAPVQDPGLVLGQVARALGLPDAPGGRVSARVIDALVDKEVLLVVDNCEQVLAAGLDLTEPLRACPGVRLLVTSRERLHLAAEREFPVGPLAVPHSDDVADLDRLVAVPAVAMLVARVRCVQPAFAVTAANAQAVTEICQRLDGLPLALELAAARAKLFTPAELADRLRDRMAVLTTNARDAPARHRTLRAALEWSYDLLAEHERTLFRRLSAFVGSWTLDAAEQVCGDRDTDVLDVVGSLLDKSLVRRPTQGGVTEFVLLESLRQYAAELLAADGDAGATRDRHAAHFTEAAVAMEAAIGLPAESDWWSGASASEEANFLSAWEHSLAEAPGAGAAPRGGAGVALLLPRPPRHGARTARPDPAGGRGSATRRRPRRGGGRRRRVGVDGRRGRRGAHPPAERARDQRERSRPPSDGGGQLVPRAHRPHRGPVRRRRGPPPARRSSTARSGASPAMRGRATTSAFSPSAAATGRPRSAS